ncbi:glycine cleavage system protein T [Rugosibacter aromaticivorans]|uniref:Aminomethyltransferase n=1 Tax=Rugosibacter aromaticivorans TaxID=1565605 RepID=A0A0C5JK96_9PROT|nr:glycine cleavage system aminomethyltransferase GcvT [Rugosibacter aromaticivorans]AJP47811.1 glycine cleavage system protein T [Rugosibacter aromaticivorans]TBR16168.1 MAG: glycine cleavage system aminomethyltransferase GcvT [Rugosibacter sp.]
MPERTPLYAAHLAAGARIVDFAGWEMPIHYGSQIEEHHAVRRDAGLFDVSHMCALDLIGPDATRFLRHLLANDVAKLATTGRALYSCMLNESGGVIDDLIVYFFTPTCYRLVVNAGTAEKDITWMQAQLAGFDAKITSRRGGEDESEKKHALAMLAVQGPQVRERFWAAFPASRAATESLAPFHACEWPTDKGLWLIARTGYTGEDGFEITLPASAAAEVWQKLIATGIKPCGLGARDTLRLEAGMNLYGQDMDETTSPLDTGLAWTIDKQDANRDFIGKSALATRRAAHQFIGLLLLERGILRAHQKVITPLGEGEITSGTFSPTLNQSIAFARLPIGSIGVPLGSEVDVEIRDKRLKARVVKPPFVRNGKSLL